MQWHIQGSTCWAIVNVSPLCMALDAAPVSSARTVPFFARSHFGRCRVVSVPCK